VFWIGLNPKPLLDVMDVSVTHLIEQVAEGAKHLPAGDHGDGHHATWIEWGQQIRQFLAIR
jgi:hypothetical protein